MKIKMYSANWCSDCIVAKNFLDDNKVLYESIDITKDPAASEYVIKVNGGKRIIPTFEIEGKIYTNPGIVELSKIITQ